jgi:hypothetical protein
MKTNYNQTYLAMTLIFVCLLVLSCGRNLTRRHAAEMISQKFGYPSPREKRIKIGESRLDFYADSGDEASFLQSPAAAEIKKYQEAGLIKIENLAIRGDFLPRSHVATFLVRLTPEGRRYIVNDDAVYPSVRLCSDVLDKVTGIALSGAGNQAAVEFSTRCSETTTFGKIDGIDEARLDAHQVVMQLYDDGWRI